LFEEEEEERVFVLRFLFSTASSVSDDDDVVHPYRDDVAVTATAAYGKCFVPNRDDIPAMVKTSCCRFTFSGIVYPTNRLYQSQSV
jgi:hypothetical protein